MKTSFNVNDFEYHIEHKTLNRLLPLRIPEIQFCIDNHKGFADWYENRFTRWHRGVDRDDIQALVSSLNQCLPEISAHAKVIEFRDRQAKEIENLVEEFRLSHIIPYCNRSKYDFVSGMGDWFFVNKNGDTVENEDIGNKTIVSLLSMEIDEKFQIGEYMESYFSPKGYRKSVVELREKQP